MITLDNIIFMIKGIKSQLCTHPDRYFILYFNIKTGEVISVDEDCIKRGFILNEHPELVLLVCIDKNSINKYIMNNHLTDKFCSLLTYFHGKY